MNGSVRTYAIELLEDSTDIQYYDIYCQIHIVILISSSSSAPLA